MPLKHTDVPLVSGQLLQACEMLTYKLSMGSGHRLSLEACNAR